MGKTTRRTLRRPLAILALAMVALSALPRLQAPALAAPRSAGHIVANEVRHEGPAARGEVATLGGEEAQTFALGESGAATLSVTSEVVDAGQRFDHVGAHWRAAPGKERSLFVEIRWSADGSTWSDWQLLQEEEDMAEVATNEHYAAPLPVGDARYAEYRIWLTDGDLEAARAIGLTFLDVTGLNLSPLARLLNDVAGAWRDPGSSWRVAAASASPRIRTRQDWGAEEIRWCLRCALRPRAGGRDVVFEPRRDPRPIGAHGAVSARR